MIAITRGACPGEHGNSSNIWQAFYVLILFQQNIYLRKQEFEWSSYTCTYYLTPHLPPNSPSPDLYISTRTPHLLKSKFLVFLRMCRIEKICQIDAKSPEVSSHDTTCLLIWHHVSAHMTPLLRKMVLGDLQFRRFGSLGDVEIQSLSKSRISGTKLARSAVLPYNESYCILRRFAVYTSVHISPYTLLSHFTPQMKPLGRKIQKSRKTYKKLEIYHLKPRRVTRQNHENKKHENVRMLSTCTQINTDLKYHSTWIRELIYHL